MDLISRLDRMITFAYYSEEYGIRPISVTLGHDIFYQLKGIADRYLVTGKSDNYYFMGLPVFIDDEEGVISVDYEMV